MKWASKGSNHSSALLIVVAQLLETARDCFTHTEAAKEPVIRVPAAVVDGTAVATVVVAVLAGRRRRTLGCVLRLEIAGRGASRRHIDWADRSIVLVKVGVSRGAPWDVSRLRHA